MERPEFENIKDFEEFNKYYWYREELIKICISDRMMTSQLR